LATQTQILPPAKPGNPNWALKQHTLAHLSDQKGASVWKSSKKGLLAFSWRDKKPLNILMNCFVRPQSGGWKNGWQVPNIIMSYHSTLGFVDQANAYRLSYHYLH